MPENLGKYFEDLKRSEQGRQSKEYKILEESAQSFDTAEPERLNREAEKLRIDQEAQIYFGNKLKGIKPATPLKDQAVIARVAELQATYDSEHRPVSIDNNPARGRTTPMNASESQLGETEELVSGS